MLILLWSLFALAEDAIGIERIQYGQIKTSNPKLILKINQDIEKVQVKMRCGAKSFSFGPEPATRGRTIEVDLAVGVGKSQCSGKLSAVFEGGGGGEAPLKFAIQMFDQLKLHIDRAKVNLNNKTLSVSADRPVANYQIIILDPQEKKIGSGQTSGNKSSAPKQVKWQQNHDDVAIIRVKAQDIYGFWSQTDLYPWHYDIPHEDVIFESNRTEIRSTEEYKLVDVKKEVDKIFEKYARFAKANLYVAGYTDTVGDPSKNLKLSKARAHAIALWFKKQGFSGKIYYQGFGESALKVQTADGVDEAQNRRALYVVAAEKPPISNDLPRAKWTMLK